MTNEVIVSHSLPPDHTERLARAHLSLEGLSVGDAFGQCFFGNPETTGLRMRERQIPPSPWWYTDDTAMAISVFQCLSERGEIERDHLAQLFAEEYLREPRRGYGGTAHSILRAIGSGTPWAEAAGSAFSGMGSMGNGGAMRAGPLGAYFADDIPELIRQARFSAEVTHAHPEGQAGAIATALAAAWAWNHREAISRVNSREMIEFVVTHTPEGDTHTGIRRSLDIPFARNPQTVAAMLGNGSQVTAPDTAPFSIWCAARHCWDYQEAIWTTVTGFGDIDTNCAIVGGIVALSLPAGSIPADWISARGNLPLP